MAFFKEVMADQDYKANPNASICHNCLHLESSQVAPANSDRPVFRSKCGIGHFYVNKTHTCRLFETK